MACGFARTPGWCHQATWRAPRAGVRPGTRFIQQRSNGVGQRFRPHRRHPASRIRLITTATTSFACGPKRARYLREPRCRTSVARRWSSASVAAYSGGPLEAIRILILSKCTLLMTVSCVVSQLHNLSQTRGFLMPEEPPRALAARLGAPDRVQRLALYEWLKRSGRRDPDPSYS